MPDRDLHLLMPVLLLLSLLLCGCVDRTEYTAQEASAAQEETASSFAGPEAEPETPVLTLSQTELTLATGRTAQLTATQTPVLSRPFQVSWTSSDEEIISVSATGTVTAHAPGSALLSAETSDGLAAQCTVTVVPLEERSCALTISLADSFSLEDTITLPEGTLWDEIVWHSSDHLVATAEGSEICALQFGSAQLTGEGPTVQIRCDVQTIYGGQFVAHRGMSSEAPENTLPAFRLAGAAGAWGIETDIHVTSDGVFVCLHDEEIDDMTNGKGTVSHLTYDELQSYHIDAGNNIDAYSSLTVPTLEEYLGICREYDAMAIVELKGDFPSGQIAALCQLLEEEDMTEQCVVISFQISLLRALREVSSIPVQYIVREADQDAVDRAASLGNSGIDFRSASPDLIPYAHSLGCTTNVWTVDDPEQQQYWREAGIDFITSNTVETDAASTPAH